MERTDQPTPQPSPSTFVALDQWGTVWGTSTADATETYIAKARAEGATIDEWETTDRAGEAARVVRVDHPLWGIDICVSTTPTAVPA